MEPRLERAIATWLARKEGLEAEKISDVRIESQHGKRWSEYTEESEECIVYFHYADDQRPRQRYVDILDHVAAFVEEVAAIALGSKAA